ncbi:hypothetical protein AVEN_208231-1, partial [Araneus ventricosus]
LRESYDPGDILKFDTENSEIMFCLDWNSSRNDPCSNKEAFSYLEVPSFTDEKDTANILQLFNGSVKVEEPEDSFNIYGKDNIFRNSTTFDDWMKPQCKFSNSTSFDNLKCQSSPNNSTLSDNLKQPSSNNVTSVNKYSDHPTSCSISITRNNSTSFSNLKCPTKSNNPSTLYNSNSFGYLKRQSIPNNSNFSNDLKHQSISSNVTSANNWSKDQSISTTSTTKNKCASFSDLKCQSSSDNSTLYRDLIHQTLPQNITSTSDWLKPQSSSNNFSSKDCLKFKPSLNNSISSNDCLKLEPRSNGGWSKNWLSSNPGEDTSCASNDWLKPRPSLNNSAPTNDWQKYLSGADDTAVYNDWLEPLPTSNNSAVNSDCLTPHPNSNNFSANNDSLTPKSNTFVTNNAWLEPETNSNNSVTWLMPQPNSECEMNTPHQQLTTIKQECDIKPVLTELQTANYGTREHIVFQDDIKIIPSPDTEYIFKSSPEELFKICGLDDLIQTPTEEFLITSDVDDIISNLNKVGNACEFPSSQIIKEEPIIKSEPVNTSTSKEPINDMQSLNKTLNRKYFKCPQCVYNTNTREHLDEHINKIHCHSSIYEHDMLSSNRSKSRNGKTKTDSNVLQERQVAPKSNVYVYKCSNCKYKTRRIDRYQKHMEEKTCGELSGMDDISLRAPHTSNSKTGKENYQSKRSSTSNSRPKSNKCPQCSYSTHRSDCLQKHIEKVHSKSICYKCNSCAFQSTYSREYYEHMKMHYAGPPFVCDVCSYKSKLITAFVAHRVIHTGDRLFCCTLCVFSCKRKYHLKGHMISHSREKNFTCKFCFKKYSYKCSLVRHLKTACREYVPES